MVFDLAQELIDEDYHRSDVISARYGDLPKPPLQRVSNSIARPKLDLKNGTDNVDNDNCNNNNTNNNNNNNNNNDNIFISSARIHLQWNLEFGIFTYVDNNKILNINTLLLCLLRKKNKTYLKIYRL